MNRNIPQSQSWGNLLELVYNHHPDALPCLQDLLQPMDVVGIGVSERDIVRQPGNLHSVRTVPDEFIGHHDGPVQAQSLSCNGRAEDNAPALPHRAPDPTYRRTKSPGSTLGSHGCCDAQPLLQPRPTQLVHVCQPGLLPALLVSIEHPARNLRGRLFYSTSTCRSSSALCRGHPRHQPVAGPAAAVWETAQERGKLGEVCPSPLASTCQQAWGVTGVGITSITHHHIAPAHFLHHCISLASTTSYVSEIPQFHSLLH